MDGTSLTVTFRIPGRPAQTVTISQDQALFQVWLPILTGSVFHAINRGMFVSPQVQVNQIVTQLAQATNGTVGVQQKNDNPAIDIGIKGAIKVAQFRISPDAKLPGSQAGSSGQRGGAEFRLGVGQAYLTLDGQLSSNKDDTHFWLGDQVSNPDLVQAMVFTSLNQYYQNQFGASYP